LIPAVLKITRQVNEIFVSFILNIIAFIVAPLLFVFLGLEGSAEYTNIISSTQVFKTINQIPGFSGTGLDIGFFFALIACFVVNYILTKTVFGFEAKVAGFDINANEKGINVKKRTMAMFVISGILVGLSGIFVVFGGFGANLTSVSFGYGYEGIAAAMLINNNLWGIIFSGLLFGILTNAANTSGYEHYFMFIKALIIFLSFAKPTLKTFIYRIKSGVSL
jgi:simple sugar transport system permease protein